MVILALNVGSSSVKWATFDGDRELARDDVATHQPADAVAKVLADQRPHAIGHRVVHGGDRRDPVVIDDAILAELEACTPLAPLHQPPVLAAIRAARTLYPTVPQVACFDTAFHATLPEVAYRYALPARLRVRRYGFHGLSYESIVARVPMRRGVIAHLGSGASVCAIRDGVSVDTTMGLSPTGGVIMGTRPGDLDPGVLLYLLRDHTPGELTDILEHQSGLLALGGSADLRKVRDPRATEAFCYSVKKAIGGFIAILGGIDTLVLTGGIGAHDPHVRAAIADGLNVADVRAMVTEEEKMIARHVRCTLDGA